MNGLLAAGGLREGVGQQRFQKIGLVQTALALYIASVPVLSGTEATSDLSRLLGILLVGVFGAMVLIHRRSVRVPMELVLFALFVGYALAGAYLARQQSAVLSRVFTLFQLWTLTLVMFNVLSIRRNAHIVGWRAYVAGVLIAAIYSVFESGGNVTGRWVGTFTNPNTYGLFLVMAIGAILMFPVGTKMSLVGRTAALSFLLWQTMLTGSRKAIIGAIALLAVFAFSILKRNIRRPLHVIGLALIIVIAAFAMINWIQSTPHWRRVENLALFLQGEDVSEGSLYARADFIQAGLELWREHPFFGLGSDQFRYYMPEFGLRETYSHSNPIEILANYGLIGFVLYYSIYARLSWRLWSAWKRHRRSTETRHLLFMASSLWVTWVLLEIASVSYYSKNHWILVGLLLSMSYSLERSESTGESTVETLRH